MKAPTDGENERNAVNSGIRETRSIDAIGGEPEDFIFGWNDLPDIRVTDAEQMIQHIQEAALSALPPVGLRFHPDRDSGAFSPASPVGRGVSLNQFSQVVMAPAASDYSRVLPRLLSTPPARRRSVSHCQGS
jgi:hypothetical protein